MITEEQLVNFVLTCMDDKLTRRGVQRRVHETLGALGMLCDPPVKKDKAALKRVVEMAAHSLNPDMYEDLEGICMVLSVRCEGWSYEDLCDILGK